MNLFIKSVKQIVKTKILIQGSKKYYLSSQIFIKPVRVVFSNFLINRYCGIFFTKKDYKKQRIKSSGFPPFVQDNPAPPPSRITIIFRISAVPSDKLPSLMFLSEDLLS